MDRTAGAVWSFGGNGVAIYLTYHHLGLCTYNGQLFVTRNWQCNGNESSSRLESVVLESTSSGSWLGVMHDHLSNTHRDIHPTFTALNSLDVIPI